MHLCYWIECETHIKFMSIHSAKATYTMGQFVVSLMLNLMILSQKCMHNLPKDLHKTCVHVFLIFAIFLTIYFITFQFVRCSLDHSDMLFCYFCVEQTIDPNWMFFVSKISGSHDLHPQLISTHCIA